MTAYMTNIVFSFFGVSQTRGYRNSPRARLHKRLKTGKKITPVLLHIEHSLLFAEVRRNSKKKNCGKNVISAVRFFSRLSSSNFLNLLRLQPGLFFYFRLRSFLLFIYPHSQSSFKRRQTAKIAAWNWGQKMFTLFRNSRTTMAC